MPLEVRERLVDAASRAGRSLNAEIVHRLEQSLEEESLKTARPSSARAGNLGSGESLEGRGMSRKRLRLGVVGLAALVLIAVAAMMGGLRGSTSSGQTVERGVRRNVRPRSRSTWPSCARRCRPTAACPRKGREVRPAASSPSAPIRTPRSRWPRWRVHATLSRPQLPAPRGHSADWEQIGPSQALYPFTAVPQLVQLRAQRVRGRRPDDLDRDRARVRARATARPGSRPAGGGVWRT